MHSSPMRRASYTRAVVIDWRTPGGTSDIVKLDRRAIRGRVLHGLTPNVQDSATSAPSPTPSSMERLRTHAADRRREISGARHRARRAFSISDLGIGIDLMFGGGAIRFPHHRDKGYLVDAGLVERICRRSFAMRSHSADPRW